MDQTFLCPRRAEAPFKLPSLAEHDHWRSDDSCSYCGSLNPAALMKRLEAGDVELEPTDKSYKVYVKNQGGAAFKQTYREEPPGVLCNGPDACTHWVTRDQATTKFYFQHFTEEQCRRFIDLLNERKLKIGYPGHFYARPFFIAPPKP